MKIYCQRICSKRKLITYKKFLKNINIHKNIYGNILSVVVQHIKYGEQLHAVYTRVREFSHIIMLGFLDKSTYFWLWEKLAAVFNFKYPNRDHKNHLISSSCPEVKDWRRKVTLEYLPFNNCKSHRKHGRNKIHNKHIEDVDSPMPIY